MSNTLLERPPAVEPQPGPDPQHAEPDQWLREREGRRDAWVICIFLLAAAALIGAIIGIGFGIRAIDQAKHSSSSSRAPSAAEAAPTSAMVHLSEFAIEPKTVTVAQGGTLQVMNMGTVQHNVAVKDSTLATPMIDAGGSANLILGGLSAGTYQLYCQVPGHDAAGMVATLKVVAPGGGAPAAAASAAAPTVDASSSSKGDAKIDFNAKPGPEWHAFDPTLKPADGATVHNLTFHTTEKVMEVGPGVRQQMWTFNGQVPGPILRGHVGDVFNVTLVNDGKMGHSIDFHASKVSPNVAMKTINPGESLVYQFKADYAGIWMYHCGTAPALDHIGNGMYGAVVIDPPGLAPVDHEYVMVQSELYLGPQGQPGDYAKMTDAKPDAVVFNGYVSQYKFSAIHVQPGQRIRVWVLDAGPNEDSSFHIVGTIFDTVYKEGHYELRPDGTQGGSQSLDLQPAQGGFVEFTLNDPGQYTMVTHKFANVGKGAVGTFQAGDLAGAMSH
jgi:nitrite reductase (NO-forming)